MQNGYLTYVRLDGVWGNKDFEWKEIDPQVNILVGINGSGKTTILNVIAEKIGAQRTASYNRSVFYENY